jgi:hypothetical protein
MLPISIPRPSRVSCRGYSGAKQLCRVKELSLYGCYVDSSVPTQKICDSVSAMPSPPHRERTSSLSVSPALSVCFGVQFPFVDSCRNRPTLPVIYTEAA